MSSTIADNITFGQSSIHHISLEEAAKKADLYRDLGDYLHDDLHVLGGKKGAICPADNNSASIWRADFIKMLLTCY